MQATSASLVSNVERACTLGLIAQQQCSPLLTKVEHAKREHAQGDHKFEHNVLGAWIN